MFTTQMKDLLDGAVYPERTYETEQQAVQYATQRSAERKCEIKVRTLIGYKVFVNGSEVPAAELAA